MSSSLVRAQLSLVLKSPFHLLGKHYSSWKIMSRNNSVFLLWKTQTQRTLRETQRQNSWPVQGMAKGMAKNNIHSPPFLGDELTKVRKCSVFPLSRVFLACASLGEQQGHLHPASLVGERIFTFTFITTSKTSLFAESKLSLTIASYFCCYLRCQHNILPRWLFKSVTFSWFRALNFCFWNPCKRIWATSKSQRCVLIWPKHITVVQPIQAYACSWMSPLWLAMERIINLL